MSLQTSWQDQEINRLSKALTFVYKSQNTYKEPLDLKDRVLGWRFVLEDEFSLDQVLYALKNYMKKNSNMPVPADIYNLLNPQEPQITEAQFIEAQKWQERNGYPIFSDSISLIEKYKEQNETKHKEFKIENEKIQSIVSNSVKRISY